MDLLVEQDHNLANSYILPLLSLKISDFPGFIDCYLDIEDFKAVIEVPSIHLKFKEFPNYSYSIRKDSDAYYLFYDIPKQFHEDVASFVVGKYSKFSERAKTLIRKYGRFIVRKTAEGKIQKSVWLHIIDKSAELQEILEEQLLLNKGILEDIELASKPNKNNFL